MCKDQPNNLLNLNHNKLLYFYCKTEIKQQLATPVKDFCVNAKLHLVSFNIQKLIQILHVKQLLTGNVTLMLIYPISTSYCTPNKPKIMPV